MRQPHDRQIEPLQRLLSVNVPSLIPHQQDTSTALNTDADCYVQQCIKFPGEALFHSYPEYLHGLLLEADAAVSYFVPQPFKLQIGRSRYFPDAYVVRDNQVTVVELKGKLGLDAQLQASVTAFFAEHGWPFEVISNDDVLRREAEALHWLPIVQVLACAQRQGVETAAIERRIEQQCRTGGETTVGTIVSPARRRNQFPEEVALYRLLHQHRLHTDLVSQPLQYDSVLTSW